MSVIGQLRYEALDLLFGGLEAEGPQGDSQVLQRDVTVAVGVKELESLLDVSLLLLSELLAELAASFLPGWSRVRHANILGRQGLHLGLIEFVSGLRLIDNKQIRRDEDEIKWKSCTNVRFLKVRSGVKGALASVGLPFFVRFKVRKLLITTSFLFSHIQI